jgi:O-antigen ligase
MKGTSFKFLALSLLALVLFTPLYFGSVPVWAVMAECAFIFLLLSFFPSAIIEAVHFPRPVLICFLALFVWIAFQSAFGSLHPFESRIEFLKWTAYALVFLLVQYLPFEKRMPILTGFIILGVFEAIYGLYEVKSSHEQVLSRAKEFHRHFVTGTYLNRNHFAGLMELALGVQFGFLFRAFLQKKAAQILPYFVIISICAFAFLLSGSRMGITSFSVTLLFFLILLLFHSDRQTKYFVALICGALGVFAFQAKAFLAERFFYTSSGEFWGGRIEVWRNTLQMIKQHALQGIGLGNFEWVFPLYQSGASKMGWSHAHQDYLELASELGLPFFLLLIFSFFYLWVSGLYHGLKLENEKRPLIWGGFIGITSLALHALTDFNFAIPANAFLWILLFSSVWYSAQDLNLNLSKALQWIVRISAWALFLIAAQKTWAGIYIERAEYAIKQQRYEEAIHFSDKVMKIEAEIPQTLFVKGRASYALGNYEDSGKDFQAVTHSLPYYGRAWLYLAMSKVGASKSKGLLSQAEKQEIFSYLEKAEAQESGSAWVKYQIGATYLRVKPLTDSDIKMGIKLIREAIAIDPGFTKAGLRFLWMRFERFDFLQSILAEDLKSYQEMILFVSEKELWKFANPIFENYIRFKKEKRDQWLKLGNEEMSQNNYRKALLYFQKAYWIDARSRDAKKGLLETYAVLGNRPDKVRMWESELSESFASEETISAQSFYSARDWKSKQGSGEMLFPKQKAGMAIAPPLSAKQITISARSIPNSRNTYGFVFVRFRDEDLGAFYVDSKVMKEFTVPLKTTFHKGWLEAEMLNESNEESKRPLVELGEVKLHGIR